MNEQLTKLEELLKKADYLLRSLKHYSEPFIKSNVQEPKPVQFKEGQIYEFRKQD